MLGLGEHIERLQLLQSVAAIQQMPDIPGLGGRVTGNIDDPGNAGKAPLDRL